MSLAFSAPVPARLRHPVSTVGRARGGRPLLQRSAAASEGLAGGARCGPLAALSVLAASVRCRGRHGLSRTTRGARRREVGLVGIGGLSVPACASAEDESKTPAKVLYGADVSYPDWLLGDWKVASELDSVETPQGDGLAGTAAIQARAKAGKREGVTEYAKRFVAQGGKILNDRSSPSRPLLQSLGSDGPPESVQWSSTEDPDVAVLKLKRGNFTTTVNLRSVLKAGSVPEGRKDLFSLSELFFAATEAPAEITPIREITKFKRVDELPGRKGVGGVQELLRLEVYPAVAAEAESQFSNPAGDLGTPIAIYKYKALLVAKGS